MRCIEIISAPPVRVRRISINRNMRCIEILLRGLLRLLAVRINRNMRCIEIAVLLVSVCWQWD